MLGQDSFVETPLLDLAPGEYRATGQVEPTQCPAAVGVIAIHPRWNLAPDVNRFSRFDPHAGVAELVFTVDQELAAMGHLRVDVTSAAGCFKLNDLKVARLTGSASRPAKPAQ